MDVDSFKYLPRVIAAYYQTTDRQPEFPIPWTDLPRPLAQCTFGLVTSGGLYQRVVEPPFDVERERAEPTWGDPTFRTIPVANPQVGVSHLHYNARDVLADIDVLLPVHRFQELVAEGRIGGLAEHAYSFMGYQGFAPHTEAWEQTYGPQVAQRLKEEGVDCVLLTPA